MHDWLALPIMVALILAVTVPGLMYAARIRKEDDR